MKRSRSKFTPRTLFLGCLLFTIIIGSAVLLFATAHDPSETDLTPEETTSVNASEGALDPSSPTPDELMPEDPALALDPSDENSPFSTEELLVEASDPSIFEQNPEIAQIKEFGNNLYLITYSSPEATKQGYAELLEQKGITVATNKQVHATSVDTDKIAWGVASTGLDVYQEYLENAGNDNEITIAVLDTGIRASHEVFTSETDQDRLDLTHSYNYVADSTDITDDKGHGTSVAGLIAESTPDNIKIAPLKVLNYKGNGWLLDIVNGVIDIYPYVDIINLSLGMETADLSTSEYRLFEAALSLAYNAGVVITAAAGNEAESAVLYPASSSYTLAASSVNSSKQFSSKFSNYGDKVDFALPGESLVVPSYRGDSTYLSGQSGTSFSSPFLAAAVALIEAEDPTLSYDGIYAILKQNAEDLGSPGKDVYYGYGRLDFNLVKFGEAPLEEGTYRLISVRGRSLDISGASTKNGANALIWANTGAENQIFEFTRTDSGYYRISLPYADKSLDVTGASSSRGANVELWENNETCAQKWSVEPLGNGVYALINICGGKALDVYGGYDGLSTNVDVWDYHGGTSERWYVVPTSFTFNAYVGQSFPFLSALDSSYSLDVHGISKASGANVELYPYHDGTNQYFRVEALSDGYYRFVAPYAEKSLDVTGASSARGANVEIWENNSTCAQQWFALPVPSNSGYVYLLNACGGMALDVYGGAAKSAVNIDVWNFHGGASEQWQLVVTE